MNSVPTPPLLSLLPFALFQSLYSFSSWSQYFLDSVYVRLCLPLTRTSRSPQRVLPDGDLLCTVQSSAYESLTTAVRLQHVASVYSRYSSSSCWRRMLQNLHLLRVSLQTSGARWGISDKSRPKVSGELGRVRAPQKNPYLHRLARPSVRCCFSSS